MPPRALILAVLLGLLAASCESRPVVVLGSLSPKAPDAGSRAAAGREADNDDAREHEESFEQRD